MRQVVLDTETTGLEPELNHRVIEIGCVELLNRRPTGRTFHRYLNPEREIDDGALAVHGISRSDLDGQPRFADIAEELLTFIGGAELVIHNAAFDIAFLEAELARLPGEPRQLAALCQVLDTLALARELHPGQRNSLDALCKRYEVDNSARELHGALLDARILADVYLAMTGGQGSLALLAADEPAYARGGERAPGTPLRLAVPLPVPLATPEELAAHEVMLAVIAKASGGRVLWATLEPREPAPTVLNQEDAPQRSSA
ncbi:MAG: DNA polymerase III subunit epsilon [Gammaproteobacteria bacterium]|nr:DNA polymerase III subunit epsilon [Gammaproteobacteria bacterium]MBV8307401.1 DNA polymerase III subunit epsilon [Gammaproteobacteria bacterium]MBV8403052.1 DNA polymerase III subunit epsilon [Gammaproteobacteria bacterium]